MQLEGNRKMSPRGSRGAGAVNHGQGQLKHVEEGDTGGMRRRGGAHALCNLNFGPAAPSLTCRTHVTPSPSTPPPIPSPTPLTLPTGPRLHPRHHGVGEYHVGGPHRQDTGRCDQCN